MSKSQFEKLIEYVINDEEAKARELFHNIVVEKSRSIYESIMEQEEESIEEAVEEESVEEGVEEESVEEGMDASLGGDQAESLINDVEAEEEGMYEGDDEAENEFDMTAGDADGEDGNLEDRVVKLEDELDRLMAEFEEEFGPMDAEGDMDGMDGKDGMDGADNMTAGEVDADEFETEGVMEAVTLKAAPKPVTSEEGSINKRSINADNAGAKGPMGSVVKPVHPTGTEAKGRPDPTAKDLISDFQNKAGGSMKDLKPATKPVTAQASGVNTKSPLAKRG